MPLKLKAFALQKTVKKNKKRATDWTKIFTKHVCDKKTCIYNM